MDNSSGTIGLIAGMGELPRAVASGAKRMGYRVVAIALKPPGNESLRAVVDDFHKVHIGRLGRLIALLKELSITEAVMAGKVPKDLLYKNRKIIFPDLKALKLLRSLKNRSDDTIMHAVVRELEKEGIRLLQTTTFTGDLMAPKGVLTDIAPSEEEWRDIRFGWEIARKIGSTDIGQAVVVKDRAVMAIEAIEGTDEAIKRGGGLAGGGAVVIKVSKPQQDMRFDVPVVGIDTLHAMKEVRARVLALEAGKCIIIDREEFIIEAEKRGITVVGISPEWVGS